MDLQQLESYGNRSLIYGAFAAGVLTGAFVALLTSGLLSAFKFRSQAFVAAKLISIDNMSKDTPPIVRADNA